MRADKVNTVLDSRRFDFDVNYLDRKTEIFLFPAYWIYARFASACRYVYPATRRPSGILPDQRRFTIGQYANTMACQNTGGLDNACFWFFFFRCRIPS